MLHHAEVQANLRDFGVSRTISRFHLPLSLTSILRTRNWRHWLPIGFLYWRWKERKGFLFAPPAASSVLPGGRADIYLVARKRLALLLKIKRSDMAWAARTIGLKFRAKLAAVPKRGENSQQQLPLTFPFFGFLLLADIDSEVQEKTAFWIIG